MGGFIKLTKKAQKALDEHFKATAKIYQERLEAKMDKIRYIQSVIEKFGTLDIQALGEDDIVLFAINNKSTTITHIGYDSVTTNKFVYDTLVDEDEVSLHDLKIDVIDEIVFLVELFEADNLKGEKRLT
jgi:hypothetical protein